MKCAKCGKSMKLQHVADCEHDNSLEWVTYLCKHCDEFYITRRSKKKKR